MTRTLASIRWLTVALATVFPVTGSSPLEAQQDRAELIAQGRVEPDIEVRRNLFMAAADPTVSLDSLWAIGAVSLAQTLLDEEPGTAALLMRWVARHGSEWTASPVFFTPSTVAAYGTAVADVLATSDLSGGVTPSAATSWSWPGAYGPDATGTLLIANADPSVPLEAQVVGQGPIEFGLANEFPAGTYTVEISSPGHADVRVSREVLPGVGTVIEFPPSLPDPVAAFPNLVRIRYEVDGQESCGNGLLVEQGLVLSSLGSLGEVQLFEVEGIGNADLMYSDASSGVAVLRLEAAFGGPSPTTEEADGSAYAWSTFFDGCGTRTTARVQLSDDPIPVPTIAPFAPLPPTAALGAPILDRIGGLIGLLTDAGVVGQPMLLTTVAAATNVQPPEAEQEIVGGFPWGWVGGGAAAAVLGALLGSGGGGGGGDGTTGIEITFPDG